MPLANLGQKKPPQAPTNQAQGSTKSRLPQLPNGGLKPKGQGIQFLEIPKTMGRCYYILRVQEVKEGRSTKTNVERVECKFTVLETDVASVKAGSDIFEYLALQGERSLYFWPNFMELVLAASGGDPCDAETVAAFESDLAANYAEVTDEQAQPLKDAVLVCTYRRGMKKDGSGETWYRDFTAADEATVKKFEGK